MIENISDLKKLVEASEEKSKSILRDRLKVST